MMDNRALALAATAAAGLLILIAFAHPSAAREANFSGTWRIVQSADMGPVANLPKRDTDLSIEDTTEAEATIASRLSGGRGNNRATREDISYVVDHPVGPHAPLRLVTVSGYGGCNYFKIFYLAVRKDNTLALHWYDMLSTQMACYPETIRESTEPPIASQSFQYQPRLRLRSGMMVVFDDHGKELARFKRVKR